MISLENVLRENDILLVDCSATSGEDERWRIDPQTGSKNIASPGHFALLSEERLQRLKEEFMIFSGIIGSKASRTIPEVAEELHNYEMVISRGYNRLVNTESLRCLRRLVKDVAESFDESQKERLGSEEKAALVRDRNKKLYEDLLLRADRCVHLLRSRAIRIIDPAYDELVDVIKTLDRSVGLKSITRHLMQCPDYSAQDSSAPDTDERLVATAYWISMFSDKKVGILTKDTDFFKLLKVIPAIIGAGEFYPYNQMFRIPLHKNPVRLYYRVNGNNCEKFSTSNINYPNSFFLYHVDPKRTAEIREKISQFWIHFADYHREVGIRFAG